MWTCGPRTTFYYIVGFDGSVGSVLNEWPEWMQRSKQMAKLGVGHKAHVAKNLDRLRPDLTVYGHP